MGVIKMEWVLLLCLLAGPAAAQEAATEGDAPAESGDEGSAEGSSDGSSDGEATETSPAAAENPAAAESPAPAASPEVRTGVEDDRVWDPAPEGDDDQLNQELARRKAAREAVAAEEAQKRQRREDMKARLLAKPQMTLLLGGQQSFMQDPGWGALSNQPFAESFAAELTMWIHPNVGVGIGGTDSGERQMGVGYPSATSSGSLSTRTRIRTFDVAARGALAPAWLPIRPVVRAGFGLRGVDLHVVDPSGSGNLAGRQEEGLAPYARLGGGMEFTSPRYFGKEARAKGAEKSIRWGVGLSIEGGVELGGGGSVPGASSVDLGELGKLDFGPGWFRAGVLLFF